MAVTEQEAWDEAQRRNEVPQPTRGIRDWLNGQRYWRAVPADDGGWTVEQRQAEGTWPSAFGSFFGDLFSGYN